MLHLIFYSVSSGISNSGTLNFISGNLNGMPDSYQNGRGIYNESTGTVNLGLDDGTVSKEIPSISGRQYGIYNNNRSI